MRTRERGKIPPLRNPHGDGCAEQEVGKFESQPFQNLAGLWYALGSLAQASAFARYSYQSGIPFLVHNFGTFGVIFTYELVDGGRRNAQINESRTMLSQAEVNLAKAKDEVTVQVEIAYDKVEQMQNLIAVAEGVMKTRAEAPLVADRQFEQNAALASARAEAAAKTSAAKASLLEGNLGLSLAQGELTRAMGEIPR